MTGLNRSTRLRRHTELTPGEPPKRNGRGLRSVSPTNKRWNAPGRARPDEPLADWCEARIEGVCTGRATDRHHIIPRGPGSSDEAWNTLDICQPCHRHIHLNGRWAREVGYLRRPPLVKRLPDVLAVLMVIASGYVAGHGTDLLAVGCAGVVFIAVTLWLARPLPCEISP